MIIEDAENPARLIIVIVILILLAVAGYDNGDYDYE